MSAVYCQALPATHLAEQVGKTVGVTGRVKQLEDGYAVLQTSDGAEVKCQLATDLPPCKFLTVTGEVQENLTLLQRGNHVLIPLGDELDVGLARDVAFVTKHPLFSSLFTPA
ncbi:replication factor a protein 3 protein [Toxoplasma gondii GAB2-2007-GAL-DOM2]|uniref:Replication factor a protein 3 protein n=7 Tax=Toxoplasma gondii TaxID=5811 RepID=S7VZT0_TOXGG|nr:replication factor a protein 3 protein [Toxoplasma gondii GT1]KAF4643568.1 replication factor a protein 3 protein [Toxoplasma gondii]KFG29781.1 replication factor a protein 3 protein [Toxoplasma gondii GAB2-2007-GAL-DOM2]KFG34064.1 replication factor a protein 3 protein [Toxoplasma gondii FOU]KFG39392.1 replication factor a protein 3 protein [Toxoplasma gondii p89]PUA86979.1 replication factor a protein 3 protein [Toxoplasma gondii TgCATBr9]RQX70652.1 replication factor a protein 3 protein